MLLYTCVLNQPPYQELNSDFSGSPVKVDEKYLVQHHQKLVRETYNKTRENYGLEQRLFM